MEFKFDNVNVAFKRLVSGIHSGTIKTEHKPSRNGPVLMIPEPVTVCYENPCRRVLFNQARDANPFFHLFESLWMLAGRSDVKSVEYYSSNIGQFSDNGATFNGAYGERWRGHLYCCASVSDEVDQLNHIVHHLKEFPDSRRAVLQMWNVEQDLLQIKTSKDVCCNTAVYFSISESGRLDMTVTNRSNDMIWGMLGANVVHFSFLQEYIAARLGKPVGKYYQFTNNLHVYLNNWKPEEWLKEYDRTFRNAFDAPQDYTAEMFNVVPVTLYNANDEEFCQELEDITSIDFETEIPTYKNLFLNNVAAPMFTAYAMHKTRNYDLARLHVERITLKDWRLAAHFWIEKRRKNWEAKNATVSEK